MLCSAEDDPELRTGLRLQTQDALCSKAPSEVGCTSLSIQLIISAFNILPMEKSDAEKLSGDMTELKAGL